MPAAGLLFVLACVRQRRAWAWAFLARSRSSVRNDPGKSKEMARKLTSNQKTRENSTLSKNESGGKPKNANEASYAWQCRSRFNTIEFYYERQSASQSHSTVLHALHVLQFRFASAPSHHGMRSREEAAVAVSIRLDGGSVAAVLGNGEETSINTRLGVKELAGHKIRQGGFRVDAAMREDHRKGNGQVGFTGAEQKDGRWTEKISIHVTRRRAHTRHTHMHAHPQAHARTCTRTCTHSNMHVDRHSPP